MKNQLIFVYNINSDLFSSLTGFAHKIISPSTYQCSLCALTHGNFLIKQEWKQFISQLPFETVFLHKDEFEKHFHQQANFPAVFIKNNNALKPIISSEEINNCKSIEELTALVLLKIEIHVQHHHSNI